MKRFLPVFVAAALLLGACGTSYKTAPSTLTISEHAGAVDTHISVAREAAKNARDRTAAAELKTKASQATTKTVGEHIDAAIGNLETKEYTSAAQHLIAAKVGNATVQAYLDQTLIDLQASGESLQTVQATLDLAKTENAALKTSAVELQKKIDRQATDGADDHVIAVRCKSFFGLGALVFGIERLLKAGIVGVLIFAGLALGVVVASYFVGGPAGIVLKMLTQKLFGLFQKKSA